jgi:hypothetical protein
LKLRYAIFALVIIAIGRIILLAGGQVQAQSIDSVDAIAGLTPTINGIVESGEWDDASVVSSVVAVYVKQDGENLYIAFDIPDNTPNDLDGLLVCFDVNHDAGYKPKGDDAKMVVTRFGVQAEYLGNGTNWDITANSGWHASTSSTSTKWQAELNVSYAKLGSPYGSSKTFGVQFTAGDFGIPGIYCNWPNESDHLRPDTWGNLISSANWIPEFPTEVAILLMIVTTFMAVATSRNISKKSRKNQQKCVLSSSRKSLCIMRARMLACLE